jgi:elongation factor Ts
MSNITPEAVKALRERTGLPMMDCKKALQETNGDAELAVELLRKKGARVAADRAGRETAFGRVGVYASDTVGAMVELKCESAPVTKNEEFINFADDLAKQLATGPGAQTVAELLAQPSTRKSGMTLQQQLDDMFNRIREVFKVGRMVRIDGPTGGYSHNGTTVAGALIEASGDPLKLKDICMHITAMRPQALTSDQLPAEVIEKERGILREQALGEGKPENIVDKMVEGRLRSFFAESVLLSQPFVKEPKLTVGDFAQQNGIRVKRFIHWEIGQNS